MTPEMEQTIRRRKYLASLGSVATFLSGCSALSGKEPTDPDTATASRTPTLSSTATPTATPSETPTRTPTETETETEAESPTPDEWAVDPLNHDKLIGAHYYPWYWGESGYSSGNFEPWLNYTPGEPVLGQYDSRNEGVINQHIKWALEHGINWFIATWGGPHSKTDRTIRNHVLKADLANEQEFSILTGFVRSPEIKQYDITEESNIRDVVDELEFLAENYFQDPNYSQTESGKVPVYYWDASLLKGDPHEAFERARDLVDEDLYLIAGPNLWFDLASPNTSGNAHQLAQAFDAINTYTPYSPQTKRAEWENFFEGVEERFLRWEIATNHYGLDFIPTVTPGNNTSRAPYERDLPILERDAQKFKKFCNLALDYMDPELKAITVTSFNEWPEYTVIEPSKEAGQTFIDVVSENISRGSPSYTNTSDFDQLIFDYNKTIVPETGDARPLAFMFDKLEINRENKTTTIFDIGVPNKEPYFVEGVYTPAANDAVGIHDGRWGGGPTGKTVMYLPPDASKTVTGLVTGAVIDTHEGIQADVYYNNSKTDNILLKKAGNSEYQFDLK